MRKHLGMIVATAGLFLLTAGLTLSGQITNQIHANIQHSFMVGDKLLPAGQYTFRMEGDSDQQVMTARNSKGDIVCQFGVRQSVDNHTPRHSELIFNKYGNTEFLSKVYEGGTKEGAALTQISSQEQQFMKQGQHAMEHTEEQR